MRWNELVLPSTLFALKLGPQPLGADPAREELEAQRKAEEEEKRRLFARADKYKETQLGPALKPIARERIRQRPKPLGEKDLGGFEPRPPLVDLLKKRNKKEMEGLKKKKRVCQTEGEPALKRRKEVTAEETPKMGLERTAKGAESGATGQGAQGGEEPTSAMGPKMQVESGSTGPVKGVEQQPKGAPAPQGEGDGARLKTTFYHGPTVSGWLEGEGREARNAADRLLGVMEQAAVRSMASFTEAELLKGLCSAQMEATTLAGALLRKAAATKGEVRPLKAKLEKVKAQLEDFKRESAGWRKAGRNACARGLEEAQKAKKMEVLAMVQSHVADRAHANLLATKLELEQNAARWCHSSSNWLASRRN